MRRRWCQFLKHRTCKMATKIASAEGIVFFMQTAFLKGSCRVE
jgi:hypothetical protein